MQSSQNTNHSETVDTFLNQKIDIGIFLLRCTIGGLILFHGINKLMHGTTQYAQALESVGLPVFFSFGVLIAEVLAPVMLILGFKVRLAALIIAVDIFMATLLMYSKDFFKISETGGWMIEMDVLYFLGAIAILFLGSGQLSVSKGRGYLD